MKKFIFLFFFFITNSSLAFPQEKKRCFWTPKYTVQLLNKLPPDSPPLYARCQSKNDDLGNQTIGVNQVLSWSFCENFYPNTKYFCHLWWGPKYLMFDIFNLPIKVLCGDRVCHWEAQSESLYFEGQRSRLWKTYD